jgi:murein DD-endopeptidase MepM/ murein hydrolase activator NlpD
MRWPIRGGTILSRLGLPLGGVLALVVVLIAPWDRSPVPRSALASAAIDPGAAPRSLGAVAPASGRPADSAAQPDGSGILQSGQTLGGVLADLGLTPPEVHAAAEAARRFVDLRQLRPGARWAAFHGEGGDLERFDLALTQRGELSLARSADGAAGTGSWAPKFREYRRETRVRSVSGSLDGSLEESIERAGGDAVLAYAMADVLQWDLDFSRDLRTGDVFRVLFEETWIEGSYRGLGRVLALTYGHEGGPTWSAYRFRDQGFYDAEGRPLQKMFLRAPVPFTRITSRFTNRRFHPILHVFRPHHGVDYGAPAGTPVRVTASGNVVFVGWDGGGGRVVKVRHPNDYLTYYMHLSRFASGIRPGVRVHQGDLIGYVGSSGLATAPHLDYRVRHHGDWIDPLRITSVPAEPLSRALQADFQALRADMDASLETGRPYVPPGADGGVDPKRVATADNTVRARK